MCEYACAPQLPFADATVDGYRADKVFHELSEPARALDEALRILAPGGRIVLVGQDWDTYVIDSDDPALTRAVVSARADLVPAACPPPPLPRPPLTAQHPAPAVGTDRAVRSIARSGLDCAPTAPLASPPLTRDRRSR